MKDHFSRKHAMWLALLCALSSSIRIDAAVPNIITYQGRVTVGGFAFSGTGHFKFALVAADGANQVWRNDGLDLDTEPPVSLSVPVANGLFTVPLGDNSLPGMALLPTGLLANNSALKLRTWFSDGTNGFAQLAPDTALNSSPYALVAASALTVPNGSIGAAQIASNSITAGQLAPGAAAANLGSNLNPVPSGGIVFSELQVNPSFLDAGYVAFDGQITLSGDVWTNVPPGPPSTGALSSGRYGHKAVWTGTEMLVIGGTPNSDGLRYNPSANTWTVMSRTNAPAIGEEVQIAWTGSRLLVWDSYHRTGGRYNPNTDTWQEMSRTNAPSAREQEAAVLVGGYLVIWGGHEAGVDDNFLRTGGRYNPTNDTWVALPSTGAPPARARPTGTAIGTEAIFFGGYSSGDQVRSDGGRYNVGANLWSSMAAAPGPRDLHSATWSGTYLYVWGGYSDWFYGAGENTYRGMRYNPSTDTWTFLPTNGQPCNVSYHSAVWNGTSLIIWGGYCGVDVYLWEPTKSGARFNQATGTWTPVSSIGVNRASHSAVWTGTQMIVWGGWEHDNSSELDDGWRYTPASDSWTSSAVPAGTGEPSQRQIATTIWTGDALIVWGGWSGLSALRSGGIYRPGSGWTNTPATGAPSARYFHTAVWTGSDMIIWGGVGSLGTVPVNTGGRFNLAANRWFPLSTANAPQARAGHTAVWTGTDMIIWGGYDFTNLFSPTFLWTGARYNPASNTWTELPPPLLIPGRAGHTAVWSGNEMIIWGGYTHDGGLSANYSHYNLGFSYIPASNTWRFLSSSGLSGRRGHTAIWDGGEMLIWGGYGDSGHTNTGARYHPASNTWTSIATNGAPAARKNHSAVWADHTMVIWGGEDASSTLNTGAMYDPLADKWATMTNAPPADRKYHGAVWTGSRMIVVNGVDDAGNEFGANANENRAFIPRRILYPYQKP